MENKPDFTFALPQQPFTNDQLQQSVHQVDVKSLQKVVLQSFKYYQAKKSKNRYIRSKKVQQMKSYQKKLIAIVKRKSDQAIASLISISSQMVFTQENICNESAKIDDQTLIKLRQKLVFLKETSTNHTAPDSMTQKLKRVTLECEQELQKMESYEMDKKTDTEIDRLIDRMERPFKKLCNYFSLLSKEIREMVETETVELKKTDSEQTEE